METLENFGHFPGGARLLVGRAGARIAVVGAHAIVDEGFEQHMDIETRGRPYPEVEVLGSQQSRIKISDALDDFQLHHNGITVGAQSFLFDALFALTDRSNRITSATQLHWIETQVGKQGTLNSNAGVASKEAQQGSIARTALLVLGMHRSGTSALTRVLSLLGAELPKDLMPASHANEPGHWEPNEVAALHDEILASVGSKWSALAGPREAWFDSPQAGVYVERIKEIVLSEYGDAPLFVVKDPRLSVLFPLWSAALRDLDIACNPIISVRNPYEVAQSICRREAQDDPHSVWHVDRGGLIFLRYSLAAERSTRSRQRAFCAYDDLLSDWRGTMRRLGEEFEVSWPRWSATAEHEIDDFLSSSHRHHRVRDDGSALGGFWAEWISPIYVALSGACSGGPVDYNLFDRVNDAYGAAVNVFARYLDAADTKLAELGRQTDVLSDDLQALDAQQAELAHQVNVLTSDLYALRAELAAVRNYRDALLASASWRMTAPIRYIVGYTPSPVRLTMSRLARAGYWLATPWKMPQRLRFLRDRKRDRQALESSARASK